MGVVGSNPAAPIQYNRQNPVTEPLPKGGGFFVSTCAGSKGTYVWGRFSPGFSPEMARSSRERPLDIALEEANEDLKRMGLKVHLQGK